MRTLIAMWVIALSCVAWSIQYGSQHYSKYSVSDWRKPLIAGQIMAIRGAYQVDALIGALLFSVVMGWIAIGYKGRTLVRLECAKKSRAFLQRLEQEPIQIEACPQEFQVWSGQYKLLPKSEVVYESGQRRNKRSA